MLYSEFHSKACPVKIYFMDELRDVLVISFQLC